MPSNDDVINRSPVWYSGLPFILSPRSVLLITPFHRRNSKNFVGRDSRTNSRKPPSPRLLQTWLWYSYSEEFCLWVLRVPSLSAHNTHSFLLIPCGRYTPLEKSLDHSPHQYTSRLPLTCFYKVKHSQKEGKNTWSS